MEPVVQLAQQKKSYPCLVPTTGKNIFYHFCIQLSSTFKLTIVNTGSRIEPQRQSVWHVNFFGTKTPLALSW